MKKIYIISDGKCIKIGISKDPNKRLKQLQTGHPSRLKLIFEHETKSARKIERFIHSMLWQFRKHYKSEWFEIEDIEWIKDYIINISFAYEALNFVKETEKKITEQSMTY